MKALISGRVSAKRVSKNWKEQYFKNGAWGTTFAGSSEQVYDKLCALPPTASRKQIDEIIGNGGWTTAGLCTSCGEYQTKLIEFRHFLDTYETFRVCSVCLKTATKLLAR